MEAIKIVVGFIGIILFLFMMKTKVDDALGAIKAPDTLTFYFLFFWAVTAALLGGLLWAGVQQLFPTIISSSSCNDLTGDLRLTLGGVKEPHGFAAFLWPIVTNLPIVALLILVAWHYKLIPLNATALISLLVLLSLSVASLIFYDLPVFGYRGFRCYMSSKGLSFAELEFYLVLIWSGLLAAIAFLSLYGASKFGWLVSPSITLKGCAIAIGLVVGLTVLFVGFFIGGYPHPAFESARGIVAGVTLRVSLFFGIVTVLKA